MGIDKDLISKWIYRLKYPFKLWTYALMDAWIGFRYGYVPQKKLLIFRLDLIGDYLMCRPFFSALRKEPKWAELEFVFAGNQMYKDLAEWLDPQSFESFIWIDRARFINSLAYRYGILKKIRLAGFEVVIHPSHTRQYWPESIVQISGAATAITGENVGHYMNAWELNLTSAAYSNIVATGPAVLFEFFRNRSFFSALANSAADVRQLRTNIPDVDLSALDLAADYFVLAPGASTKNRRWPIENFAELARKIWREKSWQVLVIGGAAESELGAALIRLLPEVKVENLAGKLSLPQSMVLLKGARLLISNESAPIHMAATTGTAAICLSQGNHFGRWNPYHNEVADWIATVYPAAFGDISQNFEALGKKYHDGSEWPMADIEVEDVWVRVDEIIAKEEEHTGHR